MTSLPEVTLDSMMWGDACRFAFKGRGNLGTMLARRSMANRAHTQVAAALQGMKAVTVSQYLRSMFDPIWRTPRIQRGLRAIAYDQSDRRWGAQVRRDAQIRRARRNCKRKHWARCCGLLPLIEAAATTAA